MTDPFSWTIHLGQWAGVRVRIHLAFVLFAGGALLSAALTPRVGDPATTQSSVLVTTAWLGLLFVAILFHELGHAVAARRLGLDPEPVRLWPLGNLAGPVIPSSLRSREGVIVASSGLLLSGLMAVAIAIVLRVFTPARMVFNPFGTAAAGGAPLLANDTPCAAFTAVWFLGWFGYLNWVLFVANLIPALPLDGGRILRGLLESPWNDTTARDHLVGPVTARTCAVILGLLGIVLMTKGNHAWWTLIMLAIFLYLMARLESRSVEEGEFFDDSLFGYDFSQGYTSLEPVEGERPRPEGALRRWRRRRSDQRRRRRQAREVAQEARMDSILDKLHREGRAALTGEEYRFLVRVSAQLKNRSKTRN